VPVGILCTFPQICLSFALPSCPLPVSFILSHSLPPLSVGWVVPCQMQHYMEPSQQTVFGALRVENPTPYDSTITEVFRLIHCVSKKVPTFILSVTFSNLNRFSHFFHCWKAYEICYKTHTTLSTSPQACRYTTLGN